MNLESAPLRRSDKSLSKFQSTKTNGIVHYLRRWHRDAIIQLCLHPETEQIMEFRDQYNCGCCFDLDIVRLGIQITIILSESVDDCPSHKASTDKRCIVLARDFVLKEPRYSNSKAIWKHRNNPVDIETRLILQNEFASKNGKLTFSHIVEQPKRGNILLKATMRMICDAEASVDIERPLCGNTVVKLAGEIFNMTRPDKGLSC